MMAHLATSVTQLTGKCNSRNFIMLFITLCKVTLIKLWNHIILYQSVIKWERASSNFKTWFQATLLRWERHRINFSREARTPCEVRARGMKKILQEAQETVPSSIEKNVCIVELCHKAKNNIIIRLLHDTFLRKVYPLFWKCYNYILWSLTSINVASSSCLFLNFDIAFHFPVYLRLGLNKGFKI